MGFTRLTMPRRPPSSAVVRSTELEREQAAGAQRLLRAREVARVDLAGGLDAGGVDRGVSVGGHPRPSYRPCPIGDLSPSIRLPMNGQDAPEASTPGCPLPRRSRLRPDRAHDRADRARRRSPRHVRASSSRVSCTSAALPRSPPPRPSASRRWSSSAPCSYNAIGLEPTAFATAATTPPISGTAPASRPARPQGRRRADA